MFPSQVGHASLYSPNRVFCYTSFHIRVSVFKAPAVSHYTLMVVPTPQRHAWPPVLQYQYCLACYIIYTITSKIVEPSIVITHSSAKGGHYDERCRLIINVVCIQFHVVFARRQAMSSDHRYMQHYSWCRVVCWCQNIEVFDSHWLHIWFRRIRDSSLVQSSGFATWPSQSVSFTYSAIHFLTRS
jgi:hypothetical protein